MRFLTAALLLFTLPAQADPLYGSIVDQEYDLVRTSDPTVFHCLEDAGTGVRQFWDKRLDNEFNHNAYIFIARFRDGTNIEVSVNPEFGSVEAARAEALRYTAPLGRLPTAIRAGWERLGIHKGDETMSAGVGKAFAYSDNVTKRLQAKKFEETLFHEGVHVSLGEKHDRARGWRTAQRADGRFLTGYGQDHPDNEDLADTVPFVYAMIHHPGRIPRDDAALIQNAIPNRIAYIERLFPKDRPVFYRVGPTVDCP